MSLNSEIRKYLASFDLILDIQTFKYDLSKQMDRLYCSYYLLGKYNNFSHKHDNFRGIQKYLFICMYNFIYSFAINVQILSTDATYFEENRVFFTEDVYLND